MDVETIKELPKGVIEIIADKELSQRSFYYFFKEVLKNVTVYKGVQWELNWHYEIIGGILEAEVRRIIAKQPKTKDIILNLPYRSGKSTLLEIFSVWCWVVCPSLRILNVCSTAALALKSARAAKLVIESEWFKMRWSNIVLMHDSKAKANYSNTLGGERLAVSMTNATGKGGDIMILDDPNQAVDSFSDIKLRNVVSNYKDGIHSRLNDNRIGLRVICQQRISAKDLVGTLKQSNPQDFRVICIPAILTQDTSLDFIQYYDKDGLFWSTRYSFAELQKHKNMLSPTAYASQILQSSSVFEGDIIKRIWFKTIKQSEFQILNKNKIFLFIDTNMGSDNKDNDPNGLLICTVTGGRLYIIKFAEKWEQLYELVQTILEYIKIYNISKVYVENAAAGKNVISELKRQLRGKTVVLSINAGTKSKEERVNAIQPHLVNGKVIVVEDDWNDLFLTYLADFNHGKHDEAIDTMCYAVLTLISGRHFALAENNTNTDTRGMFGSEAEDMDLYS